MERPATYVAIKPDALEHNVLQVRARLRSSTQLMAVVKCNAYGHGLVEAARVFARAGVQWFGVSSVAEGVALREAGLDLPVLVFMPACVEECEALVSSGLIATVSQADHLAWLHQAAQSTGRQAHAHVFVDTGLGRMPSDDSVPELLDVAEGLGDVHIGGVYTHYGPPGSGAMGDWMEVFRSGLNVRMFRRITAELRELEGRADLMLHCAASALTLADPDSHLSLVRVGTLLYGQYPDHVTERPLKLREAFELRSRIVHVGTVGVGGKIGYGGEFRCRRVTRVATVPVGYYHGLGMVPHSVVARAGRCVKYAVERWMAAWGRSWHPLVVRIGEATAPVIGRVAMDHCALDVTDLPQVRAGDPVIVPVRRLAVPPDLPRVLVSDEEE